MWRGLFTTNLFLLTLQSTMTFTVTFWDAWETICDEKDRNLGATTTGPYITITCPPTHPWKPQNLWLTTTRLSFLLCFRFVFQIENEVLKQCLTSKGNNKRYSTALREMTSMVLLKREEKQLDHCITFLRRPFWRRWQPKLSKLSQHFFFDLVQGTSL
jgi:hypothetical protein